jgi:hypothetical protein
MRTLLLSLAGAAALMATTAFAEPSTTPSTTTPAEATVTHEQCKAVMGRRMEGKAPHEHSQDKMAMAPGPAKPLSETEMKKMHDKCAAMMAAEPKAAAQPK